MSVWLSEFYLCILQSFLCSRLNYLEAYNCLLLLQNPFLIMQVLGRFDTIQYQR